MEEHQKFEKNQTYKDSNGFENVNQQINFKLTSQPNSSEGSKSKSLDQSILLSKLSDELLSQIAHSNLSSIYDKSQKQYQKQVASKRSSNISELPNLSNISSQRSSIKQEVKAIKQPIVLSQDGLQSIIGKTNITTQQDNLIFPRQYTRTFKLKENSNSQVILEKFHHFIEQNQFEIINSTKQSLWVRKVFSKNVFKLIFHFCCGVNSNIADYQLILKDKSVELKLIGQASGQSQNMMKKIEVAIWKTQQLALSQEESLKFFLESVQVDKLAKQLKFIMETEEGQSGLDLCMFNCIQHIEEFTQRFKLKHCTKQLSEDGKKILSKQIFLSSQLFPIFKRFFQKQQLAIVSKKRQIIQNMSISEVFNYLEVEDVYRLELSTINSRLIPYCQAIRVLQRINYYISPQQKLVCICLYYQTMQQCCKTYHGGKVLLQTMDNILPILIYTILFSKVDYLYANIKFVQIFVRQSNGCEAELKMIANIYASIEYISNCWKIN